MSIIQIPKIHTAHPSLVVQLTVNIKRLIGSDLEFPHPLTRHRAIFERWVEFIAPGGTVAVAVAVVVAEEVVAAGLCAAADFQRLIDGGEEVFGEVRDEDGDAVEVLFGVARGEAP